MEPVHRPVSARPVSNVTVFLSMYSRNQPTKLGTMLKRIADRRPYLSIMQPTKIVPKDAVKNDIEPRIEIETVKLVRKYL